MQSVFLLFIDTILLKIRKKRGNSDTLLTSRPPLVYNRGMKEVKTNAMRILESAKIDYDVLTYECEIDDQYVPLSGRNSMDAVGKPAEQCFKTIVTVAKSGNYYVFMLPVDCELDLKKCALAVGEKTVETITVKQLLPLTGYVRGGCSPIGMKKQFVTVIDETATLWDKIVFSAGKRGVMFYVDTNAFTQTFGVKTADITRE